MSARAGWLAGLTVAALIAVLALLVGTDRDHADHSQPDSLEWLLTSGAQSARFAPTGDGDYELTLVGPDAEVLAFTDRPERMAAQVPLAVLVDQWRTFFGGDPPNGAITDREHPAGMLPITLSDPRWDGENLVLRVAVVPEANDRRAEPPAEINDAALLIDDTVALDSSFSVDYSLDGNYAKFSFTPKADESGWDGMCFSRLQYPTDCTDGLMTAGD